MSQLLFADSQPTMRLTAAKIAAQQGNVVTAAIFERFLPSDQRRQRLGEQVDPQQILAIPANAQRGREILTNPQRSQCTLCHRIQGSGQSVGPDLDGIARKRSKEHLLTSILNPSAEIEPQYSSHAVLTDAGQLITGLKVDEDDDVLLLRQADGKDQRISKDQIESLKIQPQSLMPAGIYAELTAQELADLLEFLNSLK
jgi:putative heme-binding domain-containing protein